MMLERILHADHTIIYRWIQHYTPKLEKTMSPSLEGNQQLLAYGRDVH